MSLTDEQKEDIKALTDRENGLKDSHLRINEIANRIEETTFIVNQSPRG